MFANTNQAHSSSDKQVRTNGGIITRAPQARMLHTLPWVAPALLSQPVTLIIWKSDEVPTASTLAAFAATVRPRVSSAVSVSRQPTVEHEISDNGFQWFAEVRRSRMVVTHRLAASAHRFQSEQPTGVIAPVPDHKTSGSCASRLTADMSDKLPAGHFHGNADQPTQTRYQVRITSVQLKPRWHGDSFSGRFDFRRSSSPQAAKCIKNSITVQKAMACLDFFAS